MQESRLFKIVYHLLNKGHATAPELAKKLEVSVRTIYRDIEALSEAGIPVYAETGRGGGIHLMSDFVLGKAMLSEKENRRAYWKNYQHYFLRLQRAGLEWTFQDGEMKPEISSILNCLKQLFLKNAV